MASQEENFTNKAMENVIRNTAASIQREFVEQQTKRGISEKDAKKMSDEEAYEKATRELAKNMQTFNEAIKNNVKVLKDQDTIYKQLSSSAKQVTSSLNETKKPNFWKRIGFIDDKDRTNEDLMATQYRARHMSSGINALFRGDIGSGITEMLSVSKKFSNFVGGPWYAAMVAAARATWKAIDAWNRFAVESSRISGGATNEQGNRYLRNFQSAVIMRSYGQKEEDWNKFAASNIGWGGRYNIYSNNKEFTQYQEALGFTRAALEQVGANPEQANNLLAQQRLLGMNPDIMKKFNYRLILATKDLDKIGSEKFLSSYEQLNKTLMANNINGMASAKMFSKFQDQLVKGTLTVDDFTRGLSARRSSSTSTLAAVGTMMAERGLGGKALQEAYQKDDALLIAQIMRRGGSEIDRGKEELVRKFGQELKESIGTEAVEELIAAQSESPWGQLTGDLKKLEVQDIIVSGKSLVLGLEDVSKRIKEEQDNLDKYAKQLAAEQQQKKGIMENVGDIWSLGTKGTAAAWEAHPLQTLSTIMAALINPTLGYSFGKGFNEINKLTAKVEIGNQNKVSN